MEARPSSHPVSWFFGAAQRDELVLAPDFQRKPIWNTKQRSALIETILLGLPIPEIFVQEKTDSEGSTAYVVVDGQQRIRSILKFLGVDDDEEDLSFRLDLEHESSPWHDRAFQEFDNEEKTEFFEASIAYRRLSGNASDEVVRDIFSRFNKNLSPVNRQELRHARYTGPFIRLAENLAEDWFWVSSRLVTPAQVRRMRDVEFVSDLLIGLMYGPQAGNAKTIDGYYERLEWFVADGELPHESKLKQRFKRTMKSMEGILPKDKTRWHNRSDFYTLFVAVAAMNNSHRLPSGSEDSLMQRLVEFANLVNTRLGDPRAQEDSDVVDYVRAVEKGASDKSRRQARHSIVTRILEEFYVAP